MTNFLMGKGVQEYISGETAEPVLGVASTPAELKAFKEWHEKARKCLYWLSISISDSMIMHIQDASTPKEAWDTLVKLYSTNTTTRKMQLKQHYKVMPPYTRSIHATSYGRVYGQIGRAHV